MSTPAPKSSQYATGFPAALGELRHVPKMVEADLILGLYALLRGAGTSLSYWDADVISGHAAQFVYDREQPECADLAFVPPVDTLFKGLDAAWKEITPSGPVTAFSVFHEWIWRGHPVLARLREPILVYGYEQAGPDHHLIASRLRNPLGELQISLSDCDTYYWRYPLDEGNQLLMIEDAPHDIPRLSELAVMAARRAVRAWHTESLANCATGAEAYRKLASELENPEVDFTEGAAQAWMGLALWKQWTSRRSSAYFFDRIAPRFGGAERAAFSKASFCYSQCVEAWQNWSRHLGPSWDWSKNGFGDSYPEDFISRWKSSEIRLAASRWVEKAAEWESKAVGELVKVLR